MAEAHFARAIVLKEQLRFEAATECFDRAIALNRNPAMGGLLHLHRAEALSELGRFSEALADAQRALALSPDNDEVRYGASMIELLHGRWREAWPHYERRIAVKVGIPENFVAPPWPQWQGEPLHDELLVLRGEQGLGDHIQFAMLGSHLGRQGLRVALWTEPTLQRLFARAAHVERAVSSTAALDGIDAIRWTSTMSLPGVLGITPDTIPTLSPYLSAEPGLHDLWKARIGADGFRVGLVWAGNQQNIKGRRRSIAFERLAPLLAIPGVRWFSLQVGERAGDVARLPLGTITDLSTGLTDFSQTAAALSNLDLVITIDTAVAHLAGAMGRPVWIMLHFLPDWRWLLADGSSRWYPTARLFRQTTSGDWGDVCARVADSLRTHPQRPA